MKMICEAGLLWWLVAWRLERRLNVEFKDGWKLDSLECHTSLLRVFFVAVLSTCDRSGGNES